MDCLSVFNPSRHFILFFIIFIFSHSCSPSLFLFFFSPFVLFNNFILFFIFYRDMATREASVASSSYCTSIYLLKHLWDHWLQDFLGFEVYIELIGRLKVIYIQWVVEWWNISSMVHSCYKGHCVTLVGLLCCSYYSTCRISRQFGERQGAPGDEGAFHIAVFTNRVLGKITEGWPHRRVMKDIVPPKYIYPIASYKQWLRDDMKWILKDEKAHMKTSKKIRRTE